MYDLEQILFIENGGGASGEKLSLFAFVEIVGVLKSEIIGVVVYSVYRVRKADCYK